MWRGWLLAVLCCCAVRAEFDGGWPRQMASSNGLCRYGARIDCCWGWTRRSWGHCQPVCQHVCKHGDCIGPNKCKCHPGFTGKTCNQDVNECGLKPRPCKHRCMNTFGSYKCYCLNGYMLQPDGTCGNVRTCAMANCQYGCEVMKGEVRCQCPSPGLQLAPDGRTCVDVDECVTGHAICPRFRKCINTFGSYICKCHDGFDLQYINGKFQCVDLNECVTGQHHCGPFSSCYNVPGSFKCKCKDGFHSGTGQECKPIPKVIINPPTLGKNTLRNNGISETDHRRTTTTVQPPVTAKRVSSTKSPSIKTPPPTKRTIPVTKKPVTPATKPPDSPTHRSPVPSTVRPVITKAPTRSPPVDNDINKDPPEKPRGDVHIPRNHGINNNLGISLDIELGNTAEELKDEPERDDLSCSFDHGLCDWIQKRETEVHWVTVPDALGGKYLTISEVQGKRSGRGAQLIFPLVFPWNEDNLCLAFRHQLAGHHVGMLQVFVQKGRQHSPAVWGRTGGSGWRTTQITLWGKGLESVIVKGERRRGHTGEMALDDISLRRGVCHEEHNLRKL